MNDPTQPPAVTALAAANAFLATSDVHLGFVPVTFHGVPITTFNYQQLLSIIRFMNSRMPDLNKIGTDG
jgi:hypothetical protein